MTASSGTRTRNPYLIGIHTNEGPNPTGDAGRDQSAENLVSWMNATGNSYHAVTDDDSIVRMVPDSRVAWAMLSANPISLNLCFVGWAHWTRAEWLAHDSMLRIGAVQVRLWCNLFSIPIVKLSPAQVGANASGLCGHGDWSIGKRDGDHTDPGAGFPWDVFLSYVADLPTTSGEDDLTPELAARLDQIVSWIDARLSGQDAAAEANRNMLAGFTRDVVVGAVSQVPAVNAKAVTEALKNFSVTTTTTTAIPRP